MNKKHLNNTKRFIGNSRKAETWLTRNNHYLVRFTYGDFKNPNYEYYCFNADGTLFEQQPTKNDFDLEVAALRRRNYKKITMVRKKLFTKFLASAGFATEEVAKGSPTKHNVVNKIRTEMKHFPKSREDFRTQQNNEVLNKLREMLPEESVNESVAA